MKGVIFFSFSKFEKAVFVKKKIQKKLKLSGGREARFFIPLSSVKLYFFLAFFILRKPLFKISKMKKKLLLSLPYFRQNKKKILSNKHWEKWTNSRTRNGIVSETMYDMFRCIHQWYLKKIWISCVARYFCSLLMGTLSLQNQNLRTYTTCCWI